MRRWQLRALVVSIAFLMTIYPTVALAQFQPPFIMQPANPDGSFGYGLACGDVNGDGITDVVAGSVLTTAGGAKNAGQAFVFFGGLLPHTWPDLVLQAPNPEAEARFGFSIAIGDVNGDGQNDIIVGEPYKNGAAGNDTGAAYIFLGGASLDNQADFTLQVATLIANAHFGWSLAAGDINGDAIADVLIGAENVRIGSNNQAGRVFVFLGSSSFTATVPTVLQSPSPQEGAAFGYSVAVGRINADQFGDVIVGAPNEDVGGTQNAGRVHIFFGGLPFDTTADATLRQPTPLPNSGFGQVVAAGDVNGDLFDDVIVGTPHPNLRQSIFGASSNAGEVYVFFGGALFDTTSDRKLQSPTAAKNDNFGGSLAAGDMNGDGSQDIIVGSVALIVSGLSARIEGRAYLFLGGMSFDSSSDFTFQASPPDPNAKFSIAVATGDVNRDGRIDALISSIKEGGFGFAEGQGKVFVFLSQ